MNRRPLCSDTAPAEGASRIKLLIVDAHEIARVGTKVALSQIAHITIVDEAATIAAARQTLDRHAIDLVLLELRLPDGNSIDFCRQIRTSFRHMHVILLTKSIDDALIVSALEAGAVAVLDKSISVQNLARAIEAVRNGYAIIDRGVLQKSIAHLRSPSVAIGGNVGADLSAQERQLMELVTQGKTNKEIAGVLGLSATSVKNHMSHIYEKLQVTRRAQAVSSFLERLRAKIGIGIADLGGPPPT
jgi:DNA-binding NarL/FixJ family response regulator